MSKHWQNYQIIFEMVWIFENQMFGFRKQEIYKRHTKQTGYKTKETARKDRW